MHFEGQVEIAAPLGKVWDFVTDPTKVGSCGPGVERIDIIDDSTFKAVAKVGIGLFRSRFTVEGKMIERDPQSRVAIQVRGNAPGSAVDGTAIMDLAETAPGSTRMSWRADVAVGGTVASIGARLLEGTANKLIGQAFDCMRTKLEA
jgi:carbon monoxide dehydrogenase subunit G